MCGASPCWETDTRDRTPRDRLPSVTGTAWAEPAAGQESFRGGVVDPGSTTPVIHPMGPMHMVDGAGVVGPSDTEEIDRHQGAIEGRCEAGTGTFVQTGNEQDFIVGCHTWRFSFKFPLAWDVRGVAVLGEETVHVAGAAVCLLERAPRIQDYANVYRWKKAVLDKGKKLIKITSFRLVCERRTAQRLIPPDTQIISPNPDHPFLPIFPKLRVQLQNCGTPRQLHNSQSVYRLSEKYL